MPRRGSLHQLHLLPGGRAGLRGPVPGQDLLPRDQLPQQLPQPGLLHGEMLPAAVWQGLLQVPGWRGSTPGPGPCPVQCARWVASWPRTASTASPAGVTSLIPTARPGMSPSPLPPSLPEGVRPRIVGLARASAQPALSVGQGSPAGTTVLTRFCLIL